MKITSQLFDAFLKCATKCHLRSLGEVGSGNEYAEWVRARDESYQREPAQRLQEAVPETERVAAPPVTENLKAVKWRLALGLVAQTSNRAASHVREPGPNEETCGLDAPGSEQLLESRLHAVERVPSEGRGKPAQFIPIRFVFRNKLTKDDRLLLAFEALVLSRMLGREVSLGKILHGDDHATLKVRTAALAGEVGKRLEKLAALLSSPAPPDLVLNRHCAECEFKARCRKMAAERDDLSLLAGMSAKERQKLRSKGVFTITQLSYTFRPRRRPKRLRDKREKYHHSLKALAIREKKIHVVGSPELKIEGTPVYLDVEGLPDREFYYLIGVRIGNGESAVQHSLWADTIADEGKIWREFLGILETVERPVLIHYGGFESTFMRRMCKHYGGPNRDSPGHRAMEDSTNLLSLIYAQFYFPTYSNGLKDIAKSLSFQWSDPIATGTRSVAMRFAWEESCDPTAKEWLVRYNAEDCTALGIVASGLSGTCMSGERPGANESNLSERVNVGSLKPQSPFSFDKKITVTPDLEFLRKAAYWDYQRDRLYFRPSGKRGRRPRKVLAARHTTSMRINKFVVHEVSPECPTCKRLSTKPKATRVRLLYDLRFGQFSIKRWVEKHFYQTYLCWRCQLVFGLEKRFRKGLKFGWNLVAYFVYQVIQLCIPQQIATLSINQLFGFGLGATTTSKFKSRAAQFYMDTQRQILARLVKGDLIHADETKANVQGQLAYVWVFTNLQEVAYLYADTREADVLHAALAGFKGVLVSDFYAAYDSLDCPQQKCLTHLLRDLNDEVLDHPYDEELKQLVKSFGSLVRPMVETVDRHGLKRHFLRKHRKFVDRFYRDLGRTSYHSEPALRCRDRFERNRVKLFAFLDYDGVPWNNNNAEHAIKAFAALRNVMGGNSTRAGIQEYLTLLSICETCEYQGLSFLDFLRSGEKDIHAFAESRSGRRRRTQPPSGLMTCSHVAPG
jgi:predicted RecB family nuclease